MRPVNRLRRGALLLLFAFLFSFSAPARSEPAPSGTDPLSDGASPSLPSHAVTLITGDRIRIMTGAGGHQQVAIDPAERETGPVSYHTLRHGDETYVFPADIFALIPGRLDPELFNVTGLIRQGFHDAATDALPIIIMENQAEVVRLMPDQAGLARHHRFQSLAGAAGAVDKKLAGFFGQALAQSAQAAGPPAEDDAPPAMTGDPLQGITKIWLDRKVEADLQASVPQVGAPTVWNLGYDGQGIRVAVLDTGVDSTHPDLAGKVVAAANFTGASSEADRHGHGTHVASIIAGTGAASGGTRKGVAPGAELLNGKVLGDDGAGQWSWVVAGMEWAVAQGAHVVNMSLGGGPSDGTDPVSQALNTLTDAHGVLFVVAAGNAGADQTVSTPAAADAALAVANFSKFDTLAASSSRGPRLGDWVVKPEIAAPGQDIYAARAAGTSLGLPVDSNYTRLSGTSMATPHVAGAAAILKQMFPAWDANELKPALVSTALRRPAYTVYQQGGGRLDLARAATQAVYATEAAVSFGQFRFPFDRYEPVSRTIGYRNEGQVPVTLTLTVDLADEQRRPVTGPVTLSDSQITVAPGETVTVAVELDPAFGEPSLYSGYITAAGEDGNIRLNTPLGFDLEPERFDLTVEATDRSGRPVQGEQPIAVLRVNGQSDLVAKSLTFANGRATLRLDPGVYHVMGVLLQPGEWSMLGDPEVPLYADTVVALDARAGVPVEIDVTTHNVTRTGWTILRAWRGPEQGWSLLQEAIVSPATRLYAVPTRPVGMGDFLFISHWQLEEPVAAGTSPVLFELVFEHPTIPESLSYVVDADDVAALVQIENRFHAHREQLNNEYRFFTHPKIGGTAAMVRTLQVPAARVEYLSPPAGSWRQTVEYGRNGFGWGGMVTEPARRYRPGDRLVQTWFKQPLRPGLVEADFIDADGRTSLHAEKPGLIPTRVGDTLYTLIPEMVDAQRFHYSFAWQFQGAQSLLRLYRDGELVGEADYFTYGAFELTPEPAEYRLEVLVDLSGGTQGWAELSTRTRTAWTFASAHPSGGSATIPLLLINYDIELDLTNTAPRPAERKGPNEILISVYHPAWAAATPAIAGARFWVSYDDGANWREVGNLHRADGQDGAFRAVLDQRDPSGTTGYVSIRAEAWDEGGSRVEQEIIRAYRLPPPSGD